MSEEETIFWGIYFTIAFWMCWKAQSSFDKAMQGEDPSDEEIHKFVYGDRSGRDE